MQTACLGTWLLLTVGNQQITMPRCLQRVVGVSEIIIMNGWIMGREHIVLVVWLLGVVPQAQNR